MKTESNEGFLHLLLGWCKKGKNAIVVIVYFILVHLYDGLCYAVSNALGFLRAFAVMSILLFVVSVLIVLLHETVGRKYSWDICELEHLNKLKHEEMIPRYKFFKRLLRWTMRKGYYAIYFIIPCVIGPFVSAIILRKDNSWRQNLTYIIPGTLMSVTAWVTIWTGVGALTWQQYIIPTIHKWMT